jgi:hypothetical protein
MGKQISFYQTKDDEKEFVAYMRCTGDVVILAQTSAHELEEFPFFYALEGRKLGEACHVWNRSISPKPVTEHYSVHGGCYCLDFMQSEVINVMRCKLTDRGLSMGRLHIEDRVLDASGQMRPKSEAFISWFSTLCYWLKERYNKVSGGAYIGPNAESLCLTGVQLTGHSF